MQLKEGTLLQGGKYRIESVLGQGGFGITYMAVQTGLNRKVAIKEFFMKEHCNRDADTSYVSVPSFGSRELVEKFKTKFVKEAQTIAEMENDHIIRIYDVFEENGTAYYVMEFLQGGSLADSLPEGGFSEKVALKYIRQIADALQYIHEEKRILHLDVKPANVMLRKAGVAVLIDFGISKHYDDEGGSQTSSTPVGVSKGYAPLEQYNTGGVSQFSPATDIYSLGATLYKLLTGQTPPDANNVYEDGLPELPESISAPVRTAVTKAMQPRRKDRPQSVGEFLALLEAAAEVVMKAETESSESVTVEDETADEGIDDTGPADVADEGVDDLVEGEKVADALSETDETEVSEHAEEQTPDQSSSSDSASDGPSGPASSKRRLWLWVTLIAAAVIGSILFFMRPSESDTTRYDNGHGYVDLGLPSGLKWATCNVGASSPEDYGDYYAWGDLKPMTDQYHGTPCREEINISGNPSYDVARAKLGGNWRMPTKSEFKELIDNCTWEWTTKGDHNGYKVTGPNGNSIFLPAAGYRSGTIALDEESRGLYWSATSNEGDELLTFRLNFDSGSQSMIGTYRYRGLSVRPVSK